MSYCTPCPPCDTNFPLLCEPLETTANGKRLVVEDSAACQKTIQTPVAQQVLKTDGAGNLTWTNGASGTVLRKDSTGLVEFATLNSVLQSGPVDLGSQPLTTTGAVNSASVTTTGAVNSASVTTTGAVNSASVTTTGAVNSASVTTTGAVNSASVTTTGAVNSASVTTTGEITSTGNIKINRADSINEGGELTLNKSLDNTAGWIIDCFGSTTTPNLRFGSSTGIKVLIDGSGNFGIGTGTPTKTLHVNGTVRLQGLPTYANNAAAITGGLVADDVYKTATGELRIVI